MTSKRKPLKKRRRAARRQSSELLHGTVYDMMASLLALARERLPWDERRTRVLILISTDHDSDEEKLGIIANAPDHGSCIVGRALDLLMDPHKPPPIIATRH